MSVRTSPLVTTKALSGRRLNQRQAPRSAQRFVLLYVELCHAIGVPSPKWSRIILAEVVEREHEAPEALRFRPLDDVLQHRLSGDRQHRFRAVFGVRAQTRALAAGHDDHRVVVAGHCVERSPRGAGPPRGPRHRPPALKHLVDLHDGTDHVAVGAFGHTRRS